MKSPHSLKRAALVAVALAFLAGTVGATAAQAQAGGDRGRNNNRREQSSVREKKRSAPRKQDRAVRDRDDSRRSDRRDGRVIKDRDRRDGDRDRIVIRDRDRDHRVVLRHRPATVRYRDLRACPPPRYISRPWYNGARRIYVHDDPFYFHAGLDLFLGGLALRLELGDMPPMGFVYYDPYCDMEFWSIAEYRHHLRYHHHPHALTVIAIEGYYLDD